MSVNHIVDNPIRLLLVGTDSIRLDDLKQLIAQEFSEHELITALTFKEGLACAHGTLFDGAIIILPSASQEHINICHRFKEPGALGKMPVLVMGTTETSSEQRAQVLDAGVQDFILWPTTEVELIARVRAMLRVASIERELSVSESRERDFRHMLMQLIEIRSRLADKDAIDDVFRIAVESAQTELGFDRLGIWVSSPDSPDQMIGAFYVDETGQLRDARSQSVQMPEAVRQLRDDADPAKVLRLDDVSIEDSAGQSVGKATQLWTKLSDGSNPIGFLFADNLLTQTPIDERRTQLFVLLASVLGHQAARQKADAELRFNQNLLRQVIDLVPHPIFARDYDGVFQLVNKTAARHLGKLPQEIIGKPIGSVYSDTVQARDALAQDRTVLLSGKSRFVGEEVQIARSGEIKMYEVTKLPFTPEGAGKALVLGVAVDISQRKRMEEKLRNRNEMLTTLVRSSPVAIVILDESMRIQLWNPAAERVFGWASGEVLDRYHPAIDPADEATWRRILARQFRGESLVDMELTCRRRDGSQLTASVSTAPLRKLRGGIGGVIVIFMDISGRKRTEQQILTDREQLAEQVHERTRELDESQQKLDASQRLASIGTLAAGVAHEINNPVGMILMAAQMGLQRQSEPDAAETINQALNSIVKNARRCSDVVKSILQFARQQKTEKWPTNLNMMVKRALQLTRKRCTERHATIDAQLMDDAPDLLLNPIHMEQVVTNLVLNAIESSERDVLVKIRTETNGNVARIVVEDNGRGMTLEQQKRVFDPFYTTRLHEGGIGLGLSVAHGIVSEHQGRILLQSDVGQGSRFAVELPLHVDHPFGSGSEEVTK